MRYSQKTAPTQLQQVSKLSNDRSYSNEPAILPSEIWTRPTDWLTMPTITSPEQKMALLIAVFEQGSNFIALTCAGAYTVDWGDGVTENIATGVQANHEYTYSALSGTDSTRGYRQAIIVVTPQGGSNLTSIDLRKTHSSVTTVYNSPILECIISAPNATSLTVGGGSPQPIMLENFVIKNSAAVTNFASLLSGARSLRNVSFENLGALTATSFMFLNCSSLTTIPLFETRNVTNTQSMFQGCASLIEIPLLNTGNVTGATSMFSGCQALRYLPTLDTRNVTSMASFLTGCLSLKTVPLLNLSRVTNVQSMFQGCYSLVSVPLFDTSAVTSFVAMFANCYSLKFVPFFNTSAATNMSQMFTGCNALTAVPLFRTSLVTNMSSMFASCFVLKSVPLFNTASVTDMSSMFIYCSALKSVPLFNTAAVTNMTNMFAMFGGYSSLTDVPLFNTAAVTNMSGMFLTCNTLIKIPLFVTSAVTNMQNMFSGCINLSTVPLLSTSSVTTGNFATMFASCVNLSRAALSGTKFTISYASCKLSRTELESIFTYLGLGTGQTITITGNYGAATPTSLSSTTVAGSTTILLANTTGLVAGMQVTGTGTPLTTGIANTFTDAGDLVNLTAHGLSDGDVVSFSSITSTTGISINTLYYVVNATANDFQVSLTLGGAAISLTTNGSGTLKYTSTIVSIVPNTSVTMTRPMVSSGTNTLAYRLLQTGTALLKGWSVTG